jgi:hypothetical protein
MKAGVKICELIEVPVLNRAGTRYKFEDQNNTFDNVIVYGFSVFQSLVAKTPSGRFTLITGTIYNCYLTLAGNKNQQFNSKLPLYTLIRNDDKVTCIKPKLVNFRNSFVEIPALVPIALHGAGDALALMVYYEKYDPAKHHLNEWDELIEN